ncbi:MAG: DUF6785 family protein [Armatimonadota bacterium]
MKAIEEVTAPPRTEQRKASGGVTWRAVLIGAVLIPIHCYWITVFEVRWYSLDSTSLPLMITPIFLLFCVVLGNLLLKLWLPHRALDQGELLVVYIMLVISGVFASHDVLQNLFGAIGHAARTVHTRPESNWEALFFRYIPWWLFVQDREALKGFYQGNSSVLEDAFLRYWIGPLAWWALFLMVLVVVFLSANILLRHQWTRNERLTFPLVQLPLAMTAERDHLNFLRNRMTWIGFGFAFAIGLINGLHVFFPSTPYLAQVKQYNIAQNITTRPWSAVGYTPISMYPFAIGLGYFIPLDLSFSCWFFYVARKMWQVFGAATGMDAAANRGFPFFGEQASGAWLALAGVVAYSSRSYLKHTWRVAVGAVKEDNPGDRRQFMLAYIGLTFGTLFVIAFGVKAGLALWAALVFFGIYFTLSFAITRVRAELGAPHEIYFVNPQQIMVNLFGTNMLGAANLTVISAMYWMHRGYRSHPMPAQLESFKMAESGRINLSRLIILTIVVSLFSILATYWANLTVTYREGASAKCIGFKSWVGAESFNRLETWLSVGQQREMPRLVYMAVGAGLVLFMSAMRSAFSWWPFHPAGYALAVSYAMDYFWFCMLIAWLVKLLLIRYGGMKTHNLFIPFFLGMILGDYTIGSIWAIIGPLMGVQNYKIYI